MRPFVVLLGPLPQLRPSGCFATVRPGSTCCNDGGHCRSLPVSPLSVLETNRIRTRASRYARYARYARPRRNEGWPGIWSGSCLAFALLCPLSPFGQSGERRKAALLGAHGRRRALEAFIA